MRDGSLNGRPAQEKIVDQTKDRSVQPDAERERHDSDQSERRRFAELAKSELEIIHVIQCAMLESDRHAWRGAPESNKRAARQAPARSRSRQATTDCRAKSGKAAPSSKRPTANVPARPIIKPRMTGFIPCRTTRRNTSCVCAPSAMRTPISPVRCSTV